MVHHKIILTSKHGYGTKAPPEEIGKVLSTVKPAISKSILMAVQGRSTISGRPRGWLQRASDIRFVDISGDVETVLHFEAPTIGQAAPELYKQAEFWPTKPDESSTGFDLFRKVISDVSESVKDSLLFDRQLLISLAGFRSALNGRYQEIGFIGRKKTDKAVIDISTIEKAGELRDATPRSQMARILGRLDMIRWSNQSFELELENGERVYGILLSGEIDSLKDFGKQEVLVEGKVFYRPSGKLLRIEAVSAISGEGTPKLWSKVPEPISRTIEPSKYRKKQTSTTGVNAFFGTWPGDETEEELLAALEASN